MKILVVCSSAKEIPLREGGAHPTGNFLGELVDPLEPLLNENNIHFTFATPRGEPISIDAHSYDLIYWGFSKQNLRRAKEAYEELLQRGLKSPVALDSIANEETLATFDAVFVPGGHGPMVDLLHEKSMGKIFRHFHEHKKLTALICHAPATLAAAATDSGDWIYKGYRMTCVSQLLEWLTEDFPLTRVIHGHIKEYPTHILKNLGAHIEQMPIPMLPKVVVDRELITGQDPYSGKKLGAVLRAKLALS